MRVEPPAQTIRQVLGESVMMKLYDLAVRLAVPSHIGTDDIRLFDR